MTWRLVIFTFTDTGIRLRVRSGRVWSGPITAQISGSGRKIWSRVQLWIRHNVCLSCFYLLTNTPINVARDAGLCSYNYALTSTQTVADSMEIRQFSNHTERRAVSLRPLNFLIDNAIGCSIEIGHVKPKPYSVNWLRDQHFYPISAFSCHACSDVYV